jgi:hypothetical protein
MKRKKNLGEGAMTEEQMKGQRLHDRTTRGERLSTAEKAELGRWYAELDREELRGLAAADGTGESNALRAELEGTLDRILAESKRTKSLERQNARLRKDLAILSRRVAQESTRQPA